MQPVFIVSFLLLWVIVVFNLVLSLALVRRMSAITQNPVTKDMLQVGEKIPDFSAETLDGSIVTQDNYSEAQRAFVFISPQCRPCLESLPKLQELYPLAKSRGVELTIVSVGDINATRGMVSNNEFKVPLLIAPEEINPLKKDYKITATPSYYLVDRKGKVSAAGVGLGDDNWNKIAQSWEAK